MRAQGDVRVGTDDEGSRRPEGDASDFGRFIGETVSRTMRSAFGEISGEGTATLQREMDRAFERARRAAERATTRVTEQAERARERAERRMGQGWYGKDPRGWRVGPGQRTAEEWSKWAEGWYAKGRAWVDEATEEAVRGAMGAVRGYVDAASFAEMSAKIEADLRRELGRIFGPEGPESFRRFRSGRRGQWWRTPDEGDQPAPGSSSPPAGGAEAAASGQRTERPIDDWPPRPGSDVATEARPEPTIPSTQEARRMAILQQLRDGQITIEDAEQRLDEIARLDR